jgi:hypothetical protein
VLRLAFAVVVAAAQEGENVESSASRDAAGAATRGQAARAHSRPYAQRVRGRGHHPPMSEDMEPRCEVTGGSPQHRVAVRTAVERAMRGLDFGGPITATIGTPSGVPDNAEAGAGDGGAVWVGPKLARKGEPRLGWILTEEVAHVYLAEQAELPHGGTFIEVLIHELFGAWAQYREHVLTGRIGVDRLTTSPVPRIAPMEPADYPPELGYDLGKHIAVAALGSEANQRHLDDWLNDPAVDERLKFIAEGLMRQLPWDGSPAELAGELRRFYWTLRDGADD